MQKCEEIRQSPGRSAARALIPVAVILAVVAGVLRAQSDQAPPGRAPASPPPNERHRALAEFEGVYAYHGGTTITIVAADPLLYAVLDEAKYPLRFLGNDRFSNASGDTIPFRRDPDGIVSGFVERGVFFARRTPAVDPDTVALVRAGPRPLGPDGRPVPYAYHPPADLADGIGVASLAHAGLDPRTAIGLVNRVADGTYPDVHSVLLYRHGRLVLEEYFYGYDRERVHQLRSATKSLVSILVGIAIDRGALANDGELVMKHLPYARYANPDPRKDRLSLRDLLTMQSGLACDDRDGDSPGNESRVYQSHDWVKYVLDLPMLDAPGSRGRYCSGNSHVAKQIVEHATGTSLPAFAHEHLFGPLGIAPDAVRWNVTLDSSNPTFAQVYLRPRDMLKIGVLFHQQGRWGGRQVISREWVEASTRKWSTIGKQDYGYFWWRQWLNVPMPDGSRRVDMVVATGNGGQKIYLVPSLDAVVVMTGGRYNQQSSADAIMARELLPALLGTPTK
jgi:CubicO group peptidase (beta-lactamase class C family)